MGSFDTRKENEKDLSKRTPLQSEGGKIMEVITRRETIGLKECRNNFSELFHKALNSFDEILVGNAKKGGKTVSVISTDILDEILATCFKFNPSVSYDEATSQWEVIVSEISATACGDTREDAISAVCEVIFDLIDEYFDNLELYMRIEKTKAQYPYYLRIKHCSSIEDILKVLNLDK